MNPHKDPDRPSSGLESHLRSLILTNNAPESQAKEGPSGLSQDDAHAVANNTQPLPTSHNGPPTPKSGKKRLNQAQRRQMNSQLSIPVDTREQSAPTAPSSFYPGRGQHWGGPNHPRHMTTTSKSSPGFGRGRGGPQYGTRGPQYADNFDRFSPQSQHRQSDPSFMAQDPQSPTGWRRGAAQPPHARRQIFRPEEIGNQASLLDRLCYLVVANSEIERSEIAEKETFRMRIELLIRSVITNYEQEQAQRWDFPSPSVELKCFGSLSSGFATKASDMDLALLSPLSRVQPDEKGSPIPRLVEKALLDAGIGARLLTRTRVPIIKLCEKPPDNLYRDLQAQREKWEQGIGTEHQDEHEEEEHDHVDPETKGQGMNDAEQEHKELRQTENEAATSATEFEVPSLQGSEPLSLYLRQAPGSSLTTYYGTAKRVLRKTGVHDVRNPSFHNFTDLQREILNKICQAFVRGLADDSLRQQLEVYPSLSFNAPENVPDNHSLAGVFCQIEGEHALRQWTEWMANEGITMPSQAENAVRAWKQAQHKPTYGMDPVGYNKELQILLDRLKTIPSLQLATLQQAQEETPAQYHQRTLGIVSNLGGQINFPRGLTTVILERYVSGINFKEVRQAITAFIETTDEPVTLSTVSRKHKSLQLAREFARGLQKGSYGADCDEDIKAYIDILQSPMRRSTKGHEQFDFVVPVSRKSTHLLAKIRNLPDPHLLVGDPSKNRYKDSLEFPKFGAGVQCDINFSAHLALQNTILLRCYAHADPRVRPMVLFIKHWAKMRGINSGYRGTLSSYGYVLMVLHYLVNVAQPFVCPNLQQLAPPPPPHLTPAEIERTVDFRGYNIQFWRNEEEIQHLARVNQLNHNNQSIGHLLRGFFEYFAQSGPMSTGNGRGFDWGRDVLSLRTAGGLLSKQNKGWTGAKTVYETQTSNDGSVPKASNTGANVDSPADDAGNRPQPKSDDVKEVRLRYLFAVEDPFELEHNVARTVTHNGIVSIRDEFRRVWRLIKAAGVGDVSEDLLQDVNEEKKVDENSLGNLMHEIHGPIIFDDDDV